MTKNILSKRILVYELIGFGIVIVLLWLDEILDIPHHLFAARATPINITESIFETVIIACLTIAVVRITARLIKKIRYLEGYMLICSFCKKVRDGEDWIRFEKYISEHSEAELSHGLCPECAAKHYGDIVKRNST